MKVAHWLKDQPQVARILHPAFAECPGHEHWRRDFSGSSGLFSFALKGGDEAARDRLVDSLELFGIGYSWGGFESLAVPADTDQLRTAARREYPRPAGSPPHRPRGSRRSDRRPGARPWPTIPAS